MLKDLTRAGDGDGWVDKDGCYWPSKLDYMCIGVLPSCGCGDPPSIARYVLSMMENHTYDATSSVMVTHAFENNSYDDLPTMFFLSWADRSGYTEHGTTIRCSWRSELGKELMNDLYEVLKEDK